MPTPNPNIHDPDIYLKALASETSAGSSFEAGISAHTISDIAISGELEGAAQGQGSLISLIGRDRVPTMAATLGTPSVGGKVG